MMDDPLLDERLHAEALVDLGKLNALSKGTDILWKPLLRLASQNGGKLKVLDIATGGGDTPLELSARAASEGIAMKIDGCDFSQRAVDFAREEASKAKCDSDFFRLNVIDEALPTDYDVMMCSLFTHHIDEDDVVLLLSKMGSASRLAVLVNDLLRSQLNLILVTLGTRLFCKSKVVHFDGPASVHGAYTLHEMKSMAEKARLEQIVVTEHFPCRLLLESRRI